MRAAFRKRDALNLPARHLCIQRNTTLRLRPISLILNGSTGEATSPLRDEFGETLTLRFKKARTLRYGENPHQRAAFYKTETDPGACAAWANQLSGQPLSFNNILDLEAALEIVKDFSQPACAIIKHNNPCGLAIGDNGQEAFTKALACESHLCFRLNRWVKPQSDNSDGEHDSRSSERRRENRRDYRTGLH